MNAPSSVTLEAEAYRLWRAGHLNEARATAERAVAGQSMCRPAHAMLATILMELGRLAESEAVICDALQRKPGSADAYDGLAHISMLLGQHQRSNALYRRVVELGPDEARYWYNLASSERSLGRLTEAELACNRAINLDRRHYGSYLLRSELRVQSPEANHVAELRAALVAHGLDERVKIPLAYALAKELDDLGHYDEAFRWFAEAATSRRRLLDYDVAADERKLRRIRDVFNEDCLRPAGHSVSSGRYIFIVGLPRTGTTLLEHILTGLDGVRSNGETDNFAKALLGAASAAGADVFERSANADPGVVAAKYASLANFRHPGSVIIEKLPMNYLYIGAIHRALPDAKILLISRHIVDTCFAMFRTLFYGAYPFTYDFNDLARYYAAYEQLMGHWRRTLGDTIYELRYEALVREPQLVGAAVAAHCGLEWNASAVDIHRRASISLTASAAQVRRPIYGSSAGRWQRYRVHLTPLIHALRKYNVPLPLDVT